MPIKFKCPSCDQMLGIAKRKAGAVISCPRCSYPATVPHEEGETARPAMVGRAPTGRPAFERGDFDRWIGGRPAGGVAVAEAPLAPMPTLSEKHASAIEPHRERRHSEPGAPVIDVRLAVALVLGVGLLAFGGGFWMGRNAAFGKPETSRTGPTADNSKANRVAPGADAAAKSEANTPKYLLNGRVTYRVRSDKAAPDASKPDAGARILAFPTGQKPLRKIAVGGLRPADEKGLDQTGVEGLTKLGGAAATADANGDYTLSLPKEGNYWVLIISKNASRAGPVNLQLDEQKLQDYFENVTGLLGEKDYAFAVRKSRSDADGSVSYASYSPEFAPLKP